MMPPPHFPPPNPLGPRERVQMPLLSYPHSQVDYSPDSWRQKLRSERDKSDDNGLISKIPGAVESGVLSAGPEEMPPDPEVGSTLQRGETHEVEVPAESCQFQESSIGTSTTDKMSGIQLVSCKALDSRPQELSQNLALNSAQSDILDEGSIPQRRSSQLFVRQDKGHLNYTDVSLGSGRNGTSDQIHKSQSSSLAFSLSSVAETYLDFDLLDQTRNAPKFLAYLLDTIQMLENQVRFLSARKNNESADGDPESEQEEQTDPRLQVLHRVYCTAAYHNHDRMIYEDEPTFDNDAGNEVNYGYKNDKLLVGKIGIYNIEQYLSRHPDICFIIFKEYNCHIDLKPQRERQKHSYNPSSRVSDRAERMRIVSPLLTKAMSKVAQFGPDEQTYSWDDAKEMDAPYNLLFHHRRQLTALAEDSMTYKDVVNPLLKFLAENYENEYLLAESLFEKGLVTAFHIGRLFKPNQMVITRHHQTGFLEAYVLSKLPTKERDKLLFYGWSWDYNGSDLSRKQWTGNIDSLPDEEFPISELPIHPVEFALPGDIEKLESRGKKFWDMREQYFSCYTGWDNNHDHYYVS
jgi:hypothetical protein